VNIIKLVIFDLDGTLVDAYKAVAWSLNHALVHMGYPPVDAYTIKRTVGRGDRHLLGNFIAADDLDKALSIYRQHHARALKTGTSFLPGAKKLLEELKARGYTLAIASNRPTRFTHIILKHLCIQGLFDYVLCGDKLERPKPAADILEQILTRFSVIAGEALYVGDMTIDVQTGRAAGVKTVAVLTGSSTAEEIDEIKPFKVIHDVYEVAGILEDLRVGV
jgi:phosphoglycolate phosphatase